MLPSRKHYKMFSLKQESKCFTKMLFKREQMIFWMLLFQASFLIRSSHQLSASSSTNIQPNNQESKVVNNTNQPTSVSDKSQQQQQLLQQHAAVDDLLKDTFMLLDVLDQKLASVNNKTPNAMMRDNLRALDGATENEYNSEPGLPLHERSLNDRQADFARLDEALLEENVENLTDDQVVSGQSKSNKDDSISATQQSSNVDMQNVQPLNLVKYHQSETSSLTSQDGSSVSPPSTSILKDDVTINSSSSNENKASKRSKQLAGGAPFGGGSLASIVDNDNQLASDSTERHIKFTLDLMQSIFSSQSYSSKTNLIESFLISPLSIQMVLMMMHLGARGQTRREISNCLHLTQATTSEKLLAAAIQQQYPIDLGSSGSNAEITSSTSLGNNSKLKRRHHYLHQQQQQQQQQATSESVKQQNGNGKSQQQQQTNLKQQTSSSSQQQQQQQNGNGNPHELFGAAMRNLLKDPIVMKALTSANQIFLQKTLLLSPQYDWAIKHYYSADVKLVDFQHQSTSSSTSTTATTSSPSSSTASTSTATATTTQSSPVSSSSSTISPNSIPSSSLFTSTSPTTPNLPNIGLTNSASQTQQQQHVILEKGKSQANTDYQASPTTNVTTNATYHNEYSPHHHHQQQQYNNNNRNNFHLNQQRTRSANPNSGLSSEQEQANNVQQMVNDWVEKQTKGRISNFLSSPISTSTLMMAINVLYFKGDWQYKFDPSDTESDAWFTQANGKMTKIPMMVNRLPLAFAHDPQMKTSVIELPYKAQRLGLFLLLPDEVSGIFHTMQMLNSTSFANLISSMRKPSPSVDQGSNGINVRIPKFSIESSPRLSQILSQQLGLKSLFTPDIADLSGMFAHMQTSNSKRPNNSSTTSSEYSNQQLPLQVGLDELLHKAVLQVDEQGSVAAASSATIVERVGVFNNNYFEADHPFLLFLMDKQTGLVLFSGAFAGNNNSGEGNTNNQEAQQQRQHHKI